MPIESMDLARAKHPKTTRNERHDATWRRLWVRQHSRPSRDWSTSIVSCFVSTLLSLSLSLSLFLYSVRSRLMFIVAYRPNFDAYTARHAITSVVGCVALVYQLTLPAVSCIFLRLFAVRSSTVSHTRVAFSEPNTNLQFYSS